MCYEKDEYGREYVIRYVITHKNKDGARVLADAQRGQHTYATEQEAYRALGYRYVSNSLRILKSVYGFPLEIRACRCYPKHYDPMQYCFDCP